MRGVGALFCMMHHVRQLQVRLGLSPSHPERERRQFATIRPEHSIKSGSHSTLEPGELPSTVCEAVRRCSLLSFISDCSIVLPSWRRTEAPDQAFSSIIIICIFYIL